MRQIFCLTAAMGFWALAGQAHADPCEADVRGFQPGDGFAGQVRYVGDGDSLCVGTSADPAGWIEVRLGDFDAPELSNPGGERGKALLKQVAAGRQAQCVAVAGRSGRAVSHDRVIAVCRVNGRSLGDILRAQGAAEGGR